MVPSGLGVTIRERVLLETCRHKILTSVGGETEHDLARAFASMDINYDSKLSIRELVTGLGSKLTTTSTTTSTTTIAYSS